MNNQKVGKQLSECKVTNEMWRALVSWMDTVRLVKSGGDQANEPCGWEDQRQPQRRERLHR